MALTFAQHDLEPIMLKPAFVAGCGLYLHDHDAPAWQASKGLGTSTEPGKPCDGHPELWPLIVLSGEEFANWRSHFATYTSDRMGLRHAPMAFTEQGVAMLSSVVNSKRAIDVNIAQLERGEKRSTLNVEVKERQRSKFSVRRYPPPFFAIDSEVSLG